MPRTSRPLSEFERAVVCLARRPDASLLADVAAAAMLPAHHRWRLRVMLDASERHVARVAADFYELTELGRRAAERLEAELAAGARVWLVSQSG